MKDYDVFEQMELELIDSMKRNLSRHQKWETKEGMNWTMWQVEQLKTLEQFKKENQKIFKSKFTMVNNEIAKFLEDNYRTSGLDQEKAILKELAKGNVASKALDKGLEGSFFHLNTKKMNALINATTNDMKTAETAMLRMVNDQYRKTIFRAQVMANSGAFTLQQSIDAATKDFLKAGINCIQYKDGRRVNIATYAEMAIRTANKRAILTSEGDARNAYGIHTVRISRYGQCSETCLPWQGRVYVDDKFSGGTKEEAKEKNLPLLSVAIDGGLFHPNCKHRSTTYFYDVKKSLGKLKDDGIENPPEEHEHRKNHLHIQQQKRFEAGFLDSSNVEEAQRNRKQLEEKDDLLLFKFDEKIQRYENNDEDVDKSLKKLNVFSFSKDLQQNIKNDLKYMHPNDLEYINKNKIKIFASKKYNYYGSMFNDKVKFIVLNKKRCKKGSFAHEFAHYVCESENIYKDKDFQKILDNVFESIKSYKYQTYNGVEYVRVISNLFVRPYQGRTYITKEEFVKNDYTFNKEDLVEYISVGYETFVTKPYLLYSKDKMLYDYFNKKGLCG